MRHILRAHQLCNEGYQVFHISLNILTERYFSTIVCRQFGQHQIIVIDVGIEHRFVKSVTTVRCPSTYSTSHQKIKSFSKNKQLQNKVPPTIVNANFRCLWNTFLWLCLDVQRLLYLWRFWRIGLIRHLLYIPLQKAYPVRVIKFSNVGDDTPFP